MCTCRSSNFIKAKLAFLTLKDGRPQDHSLIPLNAFYINTILSSLGASLVAQRVKRLPAMRETQVRSLGQEDSLEEEMATHSSILAWEIPWTEEPGGLGPGGGKESDPLSMQSMQHP